MTARPRICLLGLENLPALSPAFAEAGVAAGEPVQHSLLAKALARRGFDVSMVVLDHGQPDGLIVDGVRILRAFRPGQGMRVVRFFHPRWTGVMSALAGARAAVYYTSCASLQTAQIAVAARRLGARSVFRIASDSDCDPKRLLVPAHTRPIYRFGLSRVDVVLAQTDTQRAALLRNYKRESTLARMLVEPGRPDRGFRDRQVDALWVSNIRAVKRPDRLLAVARVATELSFEMIGGTQPHAEQLYRDVSAEARRVGNISFSGPVPYHDVGARFERARVLVNTSDVEGFPNTYLQAWSCGVPVVTYFDPDGIIARERLGFVVASPEELVVRLRALCTRVEIWQELSKRCVDFVRREYAEDRILEPYLEAFGAKP